MAADGKQPDLWKTIVPVGVAVIAAGTSVLLGGSHLFSNRGESYGLTLLVGGFILVILGLSLALWQQDEWRRPPKLPRGLKCHHFPLRVDAKNFPEAPYIQELVVTTTRRIEPPDIRVICSAPLRHLQGYIFTPSRVQLPPDTSRTASMFNSGIDAVSVHFAPLEAIAPPASINLVVFSDEPIRVRAIRLLKTKYPRVYSSTAPPEPSAPPTAE